MAMWESSCCHWKNIVQNKFQKTMNKCTSCYDINELMLKKYLKTILSIDLLMLPYTAMNLETTGKT